MDDIAASGESRRLSVRIGAEEAQRSLDVADRVRTSILPWRGQFSPQLVEYLLSRHQGFSILDPFCGSGTVLYEAGALGKQAFGLDVNPAAIILASFAGFCAASAKERLQTFMDARERILKITDWHTKDEVDLSVIDRLQGDSICQCFALMLFGDNKVVRTQRIYSVLEAVGTKIMNLPSAIYLPQTSQGDARDTGLDSGSIDLVVTSPPYINVFNYHQHYRPVVEALGYKPLSCAPAEIGANRKHRQNRFLTVIQYCIDLESVLRELWRVVSPTGRAVFVVGRSSKVKGVSFFNGELLAAIAELSETFELVDRI